MPSLEKNLSGVPVPTLTGLLDGGLLFDSLPVGAYVCDANGLIVRYNHAAVQLWGREPRLGDPGERFCGSHRLFGLDGVHISHAECPMAVAIATGEGFRDRRVQIERPDGSRVTVLVSIEVLKDRNGRVTGAVNVFRDSSAFEEPSRQSDDEARLEEILQALPVAVYTTDDAGRITFFNEAAAELWGVRPQIGSSEFCGSWKLYWPDGSYLPHDECPMAVALKEKTPLKGKEAVAERPDGTRIPFLAFPTPFLDETDKLTGAVNVLVDISGRKTAELATQRLAAIVESSDDAILSKDINGVIMSWNRGAQRLFGYQDHEVIGKPVTILIPDDRKDEEPEILGRIRSGERIEHYETVRQRKDGSLVDISLSVSPITDQSGKIVGASKIARDMTGKKQAEEQKDLLLGEMNHRVKNLFALASGIVNLSGRNAASIADLVSDLQDRFGALARAHSLTLPIASSKETGEATSLRALIGKVTEPYLGEGKLEDRVVVTGPDVAIGRATVTNLALVLHEFATNALKYGALGGTGGQIKIECLDQGDDVCIVWQERGVMERSAHAPHEGFGSRLTRATISGPLKGTFSREFTSDGVEIRLVIPRHRMSD